MVDARGADGGHPLEAGGELCQRLVRRAEVRRQDVRQAGRGDHAGALRVALVLAGSGAHFGARLVERVRWVLAARCACCSEALCGRGLEVSAQCHRELRADTNRLAVINYKTVTRRKAVTSRKIVMEVQR